MRRVVITLILMEVIQSDNMNLLEIQRKVAEQKRKLAEQLMQAQRKMAEHKQKLGIHESQEEIDQKGINSHREERFQSEHVVYPTTESEDTAYDYEYSYTTDDSYVDSFELNDETNTNSCQGQCTTEKSKDSIPRDGLYQNINFIKDSIIRFSCFQKDYIIEEGKVYTKQEFAKYIALQEKKALVDPFFREHWRNYSKKFSSNPSNATSNLVPFGPDCVKLICGSCKVVIDEFAIALQKASKDPNILDIREVAKDFCSVKEITSKFQPGVTYICLKMFQTFAGYVTDVISGGVEGDWKLTNYDISRVSLRRKEVCVKMGLCVEKSFQFVSTPANFKQEHWTPECYVCRHMASEIEDQMSMLQCINEDVAVEVVRSVCERLNLRPEQDALCRHILEKKLPGISWLAKVHAETRGQRMTTPDVLFPEKLCFSIGFCEKWVDPHEKAKKDMDLEAEFW